MDLFPIPSPSKGQTHRPLVGVCISFCLGIALDVYFHLPLFVLLVLTAIFLSISILSKRTIFLLITVLLLGWVRSSHYQTFDSKHISHVFYEDRQQAVLEGIVVSDVEPRKFFHGTKTVFTLEVKRMRIRGQWEERNGLVLVNLFRQADIYYGDHLILEGKLHRPFAMSNNGSSSSYRDYLYRQGVVFILSMKKDGQVDIIRRRQGNLIMDWSLQLKHYLNCIFHKYLPQEEAGIMQAFILGDRYDIPKDFFQMCKLSGVAHIIAISGFNVGIVAYMVLLFLKMLPIPRRGQYILTMILLIIYAFLTGSQPPVVRATIAAVIFMTGFVIEQESEPINTLAAAALIILFMNPLNLFDIGFQLSFGSVLSILLFYSKLVDQFYKWFRVKEGAKVIRFILQSIAMSIVAYCGVLGLLIYYFHMVTPVVILSNLVIVPISSLIVVLGIGLLIAATVVPWIAFTFANCIVLLLNVMTVSVGIFAHLPGAYYQL